MREAVEVVTTLIENTDTLIVILDEKGRIEHFSRACEETTGHRRDEAIGKTMWEFAPFSAYGEELELRLIRAVTGATKPFRFKSVLTTKLGEERSVVWMAQVAKDVQKQTVHIIVIGMDVTEQLQAEVRNVQLTSVLRAIRNINRLIVHERDRERLIQKSCELLTESRRYRFALILLTDEDGEFVSLAASHEMIYTELKDGVKRDNLPPCVKHLMGTHKPFVIFDSPEQHEGCPLAWTHGSATTFTARLESAGKVFGVLVFSIPPEMAHNEDEINLGREVADDIAYALHALEMEKEHQRGEEALRQSEERHRVVLESAKDAIISIDSNGTIISWNTGAQTIFGYTEAEMLGQSLTTLMPEQFRDAFATGMRGMDPTDRSLFGGGTREFPGLTKEGEVFPAEMSLAAWKTGKGRFFTSIVRDITERNRTMEALEALDRMKSEFLSNVSHELRTPLHSIRGFTKLMLEDQVPDREAQTEFLNIIDVQSQRLGLLIDSLLDMSRLESGRFSIHKQLVSIGDVVSSAMQEIHGLTRGEKGEVTITKEISATLPEGEADGERITQVLVNLLSNAVKFNSNGSEIVVKVEGKDDELLVQVIDHGIGVPAEAIPHIFERFYQVDGSMTRSVDGGGLGLCISKQIVESHGGRIWVESKEGEGSTFSFTLPWRVPPLKSINGKP